MKLVSMDNLSSILLNFKQAVSNLIDSKISNSYRTMTDTEITTMVNSILDDSTNQ